MWVLGDDFLDSHRGPFLLFVLDLCRGLDFIHDAPVFRLTLVRTQMLKTWQRCEFDTECLGELRGAHSLTTLAGMRLSGSVEPSTPQRRTIGQGGKAMRPWP
jgi:hypothetical protein